jgi:hypothetical protein
VGLTNSNGGTTVNFRVTPLYTISGRVYIDYNHDGNKDADEPYYSGGTSMTVTASSGQSDTTDASAAYALTNFMSGTYTISLNTGTIPAGYSVSGTTTSKSVTVNNTTGNATGVDFGITPLYTLQGEVCNDTGIDGSCLGADDQPYSGSNNIQITRATIDGTNVGAVSQAAYQAGIQVVSGTYTVSYSTANGYYFTASKVPGKTVPPFTIAVGQSSYIDGQGHRYTCTTPPAGTSDATCSTGDMTNLNFAISNLESWQQGWCTDLRLEASAMDVHLPNNGSCTDSSTGFSSPNSYAIVCVNNNAGTGVYYGGSNAPTFGYNGGQASSPNYIVSDPYPETFTPVSGVNRASYTYLMDTINSSGIKPVDLAGIDSTTGVPYCGAGGTADCDFEPNLPDGVYTVSGDLTLDLTNPLPDPGNNKSYVFLASGKITIKSNVLVPSATSVIFASKGDMLVDGSVGQDLTSYTSPTPNLEGFYSTEGNFIIESNNTTGFTCDSGGLPLDKRLNVLGGVIVGGTLQNQRELCKYDASCPVVTYSTGYDYLLNAPDFAKHKAQLWQETAPSGQ